MNKTILLFTVALAAACGGPEDLITDQSISGARNTDPNDPPDYPDPPEDDPTPPPTPPQIPGLEIIERASHRVTLRWRDNSDNETTNIIERLEGNGPFVVIRSYGAVSLGNHDIPDTAVGADTPYCYRVKTTNNMGTRTSPVRCAWTSATTAKPVWRLQLRVGVADVDDAGTDDGLSVALNASITSENPHGNVTAMDYGRDDFERNNTFTYDLDMVGIGDVADINRIELFKSGHDGICLRDFAVLVNNVEVFNRMFGNSSSSCRWLDDEGGHVNSFAVSHAEIRAHSLWLAYTTPAVPTAIVRPEMESRIEGLVGNVIHNTGLSWGHISGRPLEVSRVTADTIRIDADLEGYVDWAPNPEVDVDIEMRVEFLPGATAGTYNLAFTTTSMTVNVDYSWWWEVLSYATDIACAPIATIATRDLVWDCAGSLESYIENRVENAFEPIEKAFNVGAQSCPPTVVVGGDGNLNFLGCP